jgi:hypothetical protein
MLIAGLVRFFILLLVFAIAFIISTVLALKIGPMIGKWLDHPWVTRYFVLTEKCVAVVDKCLARLPRKQPPPRHF